MSQAGKRRLEGRVAMITGGANGIGRGSALRLAEEGAALAILDREADALAETADALQRLGARVHALAGDACDLHTLERFVADTTAALGPADILVNNVGQSARELQAPFLQSTEEIWRFVVEINLFTTLRLTRMVAPGMVERRHGRIVNISSEDALIGVIRHADYGAAKMAVHGFTRSLAREVAPAGVTVNVLCPGPIRTRALERGHPELVEEAIRTIPLGFIGETGDVAAAVAFLASEDGRFITGQTIVINGGRWWV